MLNISTYQEKQIIKELKQQQKDQLFFLTIKTQQYFKLIPLGKEPYFTLEIGTQFNYNRIGFIEIKIGIKNNEIISTEIVGFAKNLTKKLGQRTFQNQFQENIFLEDIKETFDYYKLFKFK